MTKTLERALAEVAQLPDDDQDRIAQDILAEVRRLRAVSPSVGPVTAADLDWLAEQRSKLPRSAIDAGTFVSQMRDEDWR